MQSSSQPAVEPPIRTHQWNAIAVGRVCLNCQLVQQKGHYDDSVPCISKQ
jgi:hypothetical protein